MDEIALKVGSNVARWRKFRNKTQQQLAYDLGVSVGQIGLYERGENNITCSKAWYICKDLGIEIEELFK